MTPYKDSQAMNGQHELFDNNTNNDLSINLQNSFNNLLSHLQGTYYAHILLMYI